ncbi:S-layer homology domain-containing protein [candidate division KSB1 bacterium]|nr:S-layer homology domain-containing protein [candidate division KSB1 bacterium]
MKIKILWVIPVVFITLAMIAGCGPKPIKPESQLDTKENHFNQGIREYDRGDLDAAMGEFQRALDLDPDYAEGFAGQALVWASKEDFKQAVNLAEKAVGKNDNSVDCHVIHGRILTMERRGDIEDWVKRAVKAYDRALKINPNSAKALFYKGETYKDAYMFGDAAAAFSKVIELKGDFAKEADAEWQLVQKIQRAAPGTAVGKKIALIDEIDRADLGVLLIEELKLLEVLDKKRPKQYDTGFKAPEDPTQMQTSQVLKMADVTDVENHWAKNWIEDIVEAKGMDVFPDHTFRPDEKITRANFAMIMQNILIMATGDESLATKFIGQQSQFPDVNASHFAYNAISLAVQRGFMSADKMSGAFELNKTVSGADALLMIRDFQNALRMTF